MGLILILFAFTLSLIINFVERLIHPDKDSESNEQFAVDESEMNK